MFLGKAIKGPVYILNEKLTYGYETATCVDRGLNLVQIPILNSVVNLAKKFVEGIVKILVTESFLVTLGQVKLR